MAALEPSQFSIPAKILEPDDDAAAAFYSASSARPLLRRSLTSPPGSSCAEDQGPCPGSRDGYGLMADAVVASKNALIDPGPPATARPRPPPSATAPANVTTSTLATPYGSAQSGDMALDAAMFRLASQHHLSDYNRMKRGQSLPFSSAAPSNNFRPPGSQQGYTYTTDTSSNPSSRQSQRTSPRVNFATGPLPRPHLVSDLDKEREAAHALMRLTALPSDASTSSSRGRPQQSLSMTRSQPGSLEGAPAPKLHRTYTEEEGQNPRSLRVSAIPIVPALSTTSTTEDAADVRMRGDSPALSTPPEASSPRLPTQGVIAMSEDISDLSPVMIKTHKEAQTERDLSAQLREALEDDAKSGIPPVPQPKFMQRAAAAFASAGMLRASSAAPAAAPASTKAGPQRSPTMARAVSKAPLRRTLPHTVSEPITTVSSGRFAAGTEVNWKHPALYGVKTSLTHPMNVTFLIPPELLHVYGQTMFQASSSSGEPTRSRSPLGKSRLINVSPPHEYDRPRSPTKTGRRSASPSKKDRDSLVIDEHLSTQTAQPFVLAPSADLHLLTGPNASQALFNLTLPISHVLAATNAGDVTPVVEHLPRTLGNLVLSSCPGKKVRLSETHIRVLGIPDACRPGAKDDPRSGISHQAMAGHATSIAVTSRSPICRDIELDLRRAMEQADVRCLVCCLDYEEMAFLGAPWDDYLHVAESLGLEVLRLPIAEGFAPASPEQLDEYLEYLLRKYTLRGQTVLVHCRGGVGRAGLFACAWMIKLGLMGPIVGVHDHSFTNGANVDNDLAIVQKVIEVIRRRRSAKAIETPQQVHFILQYITWLSKNAREVHTRDIVQQESF